MTELKYLSGLKSPTGISINLKQEFLLACKILSADLDAKGVSLELKSAAVGSVQTNKQKLQEETDKFTLRKVHSSQTRFLPNKSGCS